MKQGVGSGTASHYAATAAAEFAISKSGSKASWMPGSKLGSPEELKTQGVETSYSDSSTSTDTSANKSSEGELQLDFTSNIIRGDAAIDSPSPSIQPTSPLIPSGTQNRNPSETGARSASLGAPPPAPVLPPPGAAPGRASTPGAAPPAPGAAPGRASTPLIPSSGSYTRESLNKMSVGQLSKMLDPTVTGASNPSVFAASQTARIQGKESGLSGEALEKHVLIATILAKKGGSGASASAATIAPSSITSPTQPNIPQPPQSKPTISTLPLPGIKQGSGVPSTGTVKSGSTPIVYFNSYDSSEHTIITTAAIYNIWGM